MRLITLLLIVGLGLPLVWSPAAGRPQVGIEQITRPDATQPLTLNVNLESEPGTLDPALAEDTSAIQVVEQLFVGLVDLVDDTAEVQPELATSWTVSPDSTVYTFTLRSDAFWTDGSPVTAEDVRYGILRTLDPELGAFFAYLLYPIENAALYASGTIIDPDQVGVTAVNTTTLRIALEYPASHMLTVLALWPARPMPQWTIEAYGTPTWTLPANIVTNGAYELSEWVPDDHILLTKSPSFYAAAGVQIEQVRAARFDQSTAWTMYLSSQLDTAAVPLGTPLDPLLRQEAHYMPTPACTYYYGYSVTQPPFDNLLVRQAFSAAADRSGLIGDVLGGVQQPAVTFTPPGVFGHVDGYAEGIGEPYSPVHARRLLAEAGYPGGQGLPPITLWYNTSAGHRAIAEYVQQSWYETLGVSVTLQDVNWQDYQAQLGNGLFQIWRLGWCHDYPEADNYLYDAVVPYVNRFGGWSNATYMSLLEQAAQEQDPEARQALYSQAEEILVESDAVMIPLYFYGSLVAAKPYLMRTYPAGPYPDIGTWRFTRAEGTIGAGGGQLTSYDGDVAVSIPAGALSETIRITLTPAYGLPPDSGLAGIGHVFDLSAVYSSTGEPAQLVAGETYTLTVHYADEEVPPVNEGSLALYTWDGGQWVKEPSSVVDAPANAVTATPDHFSLWAVLGEIHRVYLPLVDASR